MKRILITTILLSLMTVCALAQTTEFTYQGSLKNTGAPASGNYDFEFALFNAAAGGAQIGATLTRTAVAVTSGTFTVQLDFGAQFPGANRFLEIRVRQTGGGAYTTLTPRQLVNSTPYAVKSLNADSLGGVAANQYVTTTTGGANFIQNTTSLQVSSNFNVSGTGTANVLNATTQINLGGNRVFHIPGTRNTFAGSGAGVANPSIFTADNTFFGFESGRLQGISGANTFFGSRTGTNNTIGGANAFFGAEAGLGNIDGDQNSFFGAYAGKSNTTGGGNAFFGTNSGTANISGEDNAFFGSASGSSNQTASFNSFFGSQAGRFNTTGSSNSFFGATSGDANTGGSGNTYFGRRVGRDNQIGNNNTAIGIDSLRSNTGSNNVGVGANAGFANVTGSNNTLIGTNTDVNAPGLTFATAIGAGAAVSSSNQIVLGRDIDTVKVRHLLDVDGLLEGQHLALRNNLLLSGSASVCVQRFEKADFPPGEFPYGIDGFFYLFTRCASSIKLKSDVATSETGLSTLRKLRPVNFKWKSDNSPALGLIAEEVNEVEPLLAARETDGTVFGVNFDAVTAVLVKGVQEQQAQIEARQKEIAEQKTANEKLQTQVDQQQLQLKKQQAEIDALKKLVCAQSPTAEVCQP